MANVGIVLVDQEFLPWINTTTPKVFALFAGICRDLPTRQITLCSCAPCFRVQSNTTTSLNSDEIVTLRTTVFKWSWLNYCDPRPLCLFELRLLHLLSRKPDYFAGTLTKQIVLPSLLRLIEQHNQLSRLLLFVYLFIS